MGYSVQQGWYVHGHCGQGHCVESMESDIFAGREVGVESALEVVLEVNHEGNIRVERTVSAVRARFGE